MSIKIIKSGLLDSIQDKGRYGYQQYGINPNGAMDLYSMSIANILTGNDPDQAVIEMHFPAPVFLFTKPSLIAFSGADFSPAINGEPVEINQPLFPDKNDILQFTKPLKGARAYLAVSGGFELSKWLNSYSTNLKAKAGGFQGRNLLKDDELFFNKKSAAPPLQSNSPRWKADPHWGDPCDENELLILPGNEWDQLTEESKKKFTEGSFTVSAHSDRMGYRLDTISLERKTKEELVSTGVSFGTIQLLPDGKLIILGADHQTTGGYPRIGHVISAHHSKLAQMKSGDALKFKLTNQSEAEGLLLKQAQHLKLIEHAFSLRV